jgi:hypothetical protein
VVEIRLAFTPGGSLRQGAEVAVNLAPISPGGKGGESREKQAVARRPSSANQHCEVRTLRLGIELKLPLVCQEALREVMALRGKARVPRLVQANPCL